VNGIADTLPEDTLTQHEPGSELTPLLPSRRNQPVMEWAGLPDDFIPYVIPRKRADAYVAGDYDFAFGTWTIASGSHLVLCDNGTWDVVANRLDVSAINISSVTIDPGQAKVDCGATLNVTTDGPVRVTLLGCGTRTFGQE
jgi:hypothetical protein